MRGRSLAIAVVTLVAALAAGVATAIQSARAAGGCSPRCVILIEVDGLEPKDVTPQNTPILWALGHSSGAADPNNPGANAPGASERSGFTWQAPRTVVSAGTASATASLLTGGYPEQTGIPSDDFISESNESWLGVASPIAGNHKGTLLQKVREDPTKKVGAFVGDPGLMPLVTEGVDPTTENGAFWSPTAPSDGVPAYCAPPRDLNSQPDPSNELCPAPDTKTLEQALSGLTTSSAAPDIQFAFIHLAELGAIKRLYGDTDAPTLPNQPTQIPAVQDALHATDAAIGEFIARDNQDSNNGQIKWPQTILFVVGDHGYESTPVANRVADPSDQTLDLTDYVKRDDVGTSAARLIPQGTMGTVYYTGSDKSARLKAIRDKLLDPANGPNSSPACAQTGGCIEDVLYVRDVGDGHLLSDAHPSWHLDYPGSTVSGDLVVLTRPGWALGRSVPTPTTDADTQTGVGVTEVANPFNGSSGGPRDRAIFALVNGPSGGPPPVKGLSPTSAGGGRYPVTKTASNPDACPDPANADALTEDVTAANLTPGDDANAVGHECQPEIVDFAPTMAALLAVNLPDTVGRFLQEAFNLTLGFPKEEVLPDPDPQPEPAAGAVEIYIPPPPPPPPPPKGFDFYGLVRDLRAQVVDPNGCAWSVTKPGTRLDYLKIEGDFGKQLSAVTLTFYKRTNDKTRASGASAGRFAFAAATKCRRGSGAAARASGAGVAPRTGLKAIAKFKPFTVKRGHVVLKLKVPDQFQPTFVGISVQEAKQVARARTADAKQPNFMGLGPKGGGIFSIVDARRLHTRKGRRAK